MLWSALSPQASTRKTCAIRYVLVQWSWLLKVVFVALCQLVKDCACLGFLWHSQTCMRPHIQSPTPNYFLKQHYCFLFQGLLLLYSALLFSFFVVFFPCFLFWSSTTAMSFTCRVKNISDTGSDTVHFIEPLWDIAHAATVHSLSHCGTQLMLPVLGQAQMDHCWGKCPGSFFLFLFCIFACFSFDVGQ